MLHGAVRLSNGNCSAVFMTSTRGSGVAIPCLGLQRGQLLSGAFCSLRKLRFSMQMCVFILLVCRRFDVQRDFCRQPLMEHTWCIPVVDVMSVHNWLDAVAKLRKVVYSFCSMIVALLPRVPCSQNMDWIHHPNIAIMLLVCDFLSCIWRWFGSWCDVASLITNEGLCMICYYL